MVSRFRRNPQEEALRIREPDVSDLMQRITDKVVRAASDSNTRYRVPITAFCGMQDNIVLRASAQGPFDDLKPIAGDHSTLIQPADPDDERFTEFREVLCDPVGHRRRFEIDLFENSVRIEPCEPDTILTESANNPREVEYDNRAVVERAVTLAAGNRCREPFTLSYNTRNEGYVQGETSHHNEVAADDRGRWEDTGTEYQFDFVPRPQVRYLLKVTVYKGFDREHRDIHCHLGKHSYYRRLRLVLDLSAYLQQGFRISKQPQCVFSAQDHEHGKICTDLRSLGEPVDPESASADGVFRWELRDKRTGIVDVAWDVEEPESSGTGG